jgi:putative pyruvate formate lyase activating enzyme
MSPDIPDKIRCHLCPRDCGAFRTPEDPGWCGSDEGFSDYRISSIMPHYGEEGCISGQRGSGTVFFSGCSLKCCFCQNYSISHQHQGTRVTSSRLIEKMEELLAYGVHNLNLVTPSHYADRLPDTLRDLRLSKVWLRYPVPVIWNSSAYETVDSLLPLADLVDVYLVDMKFHDPDLADDLAAAPDYPTVAYSALGEMIRQQPQPVFDDRGLIRQGLVIRHLVLPGQVEDSFEILNQLAKMVPRDTPLSLMSQYRPRPGQSCGGRLEMNRRLHGDEYSLVLQKARALGFEKILSQ